MNFIHLGPHAKDLSRQAFGKLHVLGPVRRHAFPRGGQHIYWACRCECGVEKEVRGGHLLRGSSTSCGCTWSVAAAGVGRNNRTHGKTRSPEWNLWVAMRGRCQRPNHGKFGPYGAKGISVCERWNDFANFLADMGPRPSPKHSLDRYPDQKGNYEPGNVRWATPSEQCQNLSSNLIVTVGERTAPLAAFFSTGSKHPDYNRALQRIRAGWNAGRAISTPPGG